MLVSIGVELRQRDGLSADHRRRLKISTFVAFSKTFPAFSGFGVDF